MAQSGTLSKLARCLISSFILISLQASPSPITCNRRPEAPSRLTKRSAAGSGGDFGGANGNLIGASDKPDEPGGGAGGAGKSDFECEVFADYGKNYLTPVDVVVKNSDDNVACIKARFALSIKVEEAFTLTPRLGPAASNATNQQQQPQPMGQPNDTIRSILGYLPLEHVLSVEDSCPGKRTTPGPPKAAPATEGGTAAPGGNPKKSNDDHDDEQVDDELEMIVTFNCGKLSFTFRREQGRIFVSSIKGLVKLDKKVVREFIAIRPMFLTSDLDHHFKYDDIIEVASEAHSKTYILTANFYFTEIEAFRTTTSRDFIQPPDDSSKPYPEESFVAKEKQSAESLLVTQQLAPAPPLTPSQETKT